MEETLIRILLVEDNSGDARLVKETLADADGLDFQLTHVERLSEARRALGKEQFDVVLLDLMLPDKPRMGSLIEIHDQARRRFHFTFQRAGPIRDRRPTHPTHFSGVLTKLALSRPAVQFRDDALTPAPVTHEVARRE